MSQPESDLNTQKRRHAGPLIGITAVLIFVAVILTWWFGSEAVDGQAPAGAETQIDGRTGEEEPQSNGATSGTTVTPEAEVTPPDAPTITPAEPAEPSTAPTSPPDAETPPAGSTSP